MLLKQKSNYLLNRNIHHMLDTVHDSAKRAAKIIPNTLSFARKSSSRMQNKYIKRPIEDTIDLAGKEDQTLFGQRQIWLTFFIAAVKPSRE